MLTFNIELLDNNNLANAKKRPNSAETVKNQYKLDVRKMKQSLQLLHRSIVKKTNAPSTAHKQDNYENQTEPPTPQNKRELE